MYPVMKRIHAQRLNFIRNNAFKHPNTVFLGLETLTNLLDEADILRHIIPAEDEMEIFGMKIVPVGKVEYLAVGYIEKEVLPDETIRSSE